jgi:hypothetical protein
LDKIRLLFEIASLRRMAYQHNMPFFLKPLLILSAILLLPATPSWAQRPVSEVPA